MLLKYILFSFFLQFAYSYINNNQWITINTFLSNNREHPSINQDKIIYNIIYSNYKDWAFYNAYKFKQLHKYKCSQIKQQELNLYASLGLIKAIRNYDPSKNATFSIYASKYIFGELYNGMTELQTVLLFTHREKIYKKPMLVVGNDDYIFDKNIHSNQDYGNDNNYKKHDDFWSKIYLMDISAITKKIIILKFSFDLQEVKSNKEISNILGYSEETIRKHIIQFKKCWINL
jgi:hypothetical protein